MYSKEDLLFLSFFDTNSKNFSASSAREIFRLSYAQGFSFLSLSIEELKKFILRDISVYSSITQGNIIKLEKLLEEYKSPSRKNNILKIMEKMQTEKIEMIFYGEKNYPKSFYSLKDFPYVLYLKGKGLDSLEQEMTFAIVGKRNPRQEGIAFASLAGKYLKEKNYYNISGLAKGIDTIGHIETLGNTGAILGQGLLGEIYPRENRYLADTILDAGGFLLSEVPAYESVSSLSLLKRNRLQVALTSGIIIAETDLQGGTVQTFRYARIQGKEIYVASLNQEFIQRYSKDIHVIENMQEFEEKRKRKQIQKNLF